MRTITLGRSDCIRQARVGEEQRNRTTSWYWLWGELWAQQRAPTSGPDRRRCRGNTKRWTSQKGASRTRPQSCSRPWCQPGAHPRSYHRPPAGRTPPSHPPPPSSPRTSAGRVGRRPASTPHSTWRCPWSALGYVPTSKDRRFKLP